MGNRPTKVLPKCLRYALPSTSVGDMVLLSSGKKYKCEMTGWSEV